MKKMKRLFKGIICIFTIILNFLFGSLKTYAASFSDTLRGIQVLNEVLRDKNSTNVYTCFIKNASGPMKHMLEHISETRTDPNQMMICDRLEDFIYLYRSIRMYERIMKSLHRMDEDSCGVTLLIRGTNFEYKEDGLEYQRNLTEKGVETAHSPLATGGRWYGHGVYFSDSVDTADAYATNGLRPVRQLSFALVFDSVSPVAPPTSFSDDAYYCILKGDQTSNVILCGEAFQYDSEYDLAGLDKRLHYTMEDIMPPFFRTQLTRRSYLRFLNELSDYYSEHCWPRVRRDVRRPSDFFTGSSKK